MYFVTLTFSTNKAGAPALMAKHNQWIQAGFDAGVFLAVGSLSDGSGGAIVAAGCSMDELESRVAADPFVADNVVTPTITAFTPNKTNDALSHLLSR